MTLYNDQADFCLIDMLRHGAGNTGANALFSALVFCFWLVVDGTETRVSGCENVASPTILFFAFSSGSSPSQCSSL